VAVQKKADVPTRRKRSAQVGPVGVRGDDRSRRTGADKKVPKVRLGRDVGLPGAPRLTDRERETVIEALARAEDDSAYAVDRLDREHCAEGRRLEQDWGRRFRALRKKLKGER
jgi:hypothetical protein